MIPIVLIDIVWKGHVPTYHKYFAQVLLERGHTVLSITPDAEDVAAWIAQAVPHLKERIVCERFGGSRSDALDGPPRPESGLLKSLKLLYRHERMPVFVHTMVEFALSLLLWRRTNTVIREQSKRHRLPDNFLVFFPYIDFRYLHNWMSPRTIERLFHFRWAALYLHPTFLRLRAGRGRSMRGPDALFRARNCVGISVLDEALVAPLEIRLGKPVVWFPDITDDTPLNQFSSLGKDIVHEADGRNIISLLGFISQKKNLTTFLRTADLCLKRNLPYFFIVVGEVDLPSWSGAERTYIESVMRDSPPNVFFHTKSIPDGAEYNSLYALSSIIYAVYTAFYHSSNTLTKAAIFHKPVIVSEKHLMAERIHAFGTGLAIPDDNAERCLVAIMHISEGIDFDGRPMKAEYDRYRSLHSLSSLSNAFDTLFSRIGTAETGCV